MSWKARRENRLAGLERGLDRDAENHRVDRAVLYLPISVKIEYTDIANMGTKTISIKDAAYERLKKFKKGGESFTDLINRITKKRSLLELPNLVEKEAAESLEKSIEESSDERKKARKREIEA